jgi:protocatechuate 3,4-dioxygenase beta subunit
MSLAVVVVATAAGAAVVLLDEAGRGLGTGGADRSRLAIAPPGEPGTPLRVTGQVLRPDGVTPAAGVVLYLHQTGIDGLYAKERGAPPRLRGWLRTDAAGRYEYRTVRPGPYPGRTIPAHVHTQLWGEGVPRQWNHDLLFADDELVDESVRRASRDAGRFAWVCSPEREADGTQRCNHDLRLKDRADAFDPRATHGFDDAPAWARP